MRVAVTGGVKEVQVPAKSGDIMARAPGTVARPGRHPLPAGSVQGVLV